MGRIFVFGPFTLDGQERLLTRDGFPVPIAPKAFDTLLLLLERAGKLVEKKTLLESVWPDVFVEDSVLTRTISDLRKALQQNGQKVWIETVPKFGYRFAAGVTRIGGPSAEQPLTAVPEASHEPARAKSNLFRWGLGLAVGAVVLLLIAQRLTSRTDQGLRSEERRVGKECRL